jgi:AraC family transcriptional regulator
MAVNPLDLFANKPAIAHRLVPLDQGLTVHYRHDLPGALDAPQGLSHHMLTYFLSTNARQVTQIEGICEYDGVMESGDFYLCPAGRPGFTRWHSVDKTLHLVIEPCWLKYVARDTEWESAGGLDLLPVSKQRDRKLAELVQILMAELEANDRGEKLYLESLSCMMGIHLLRQYCHPTPNPRLNSAGLATYKLRDVLDYIQSHLHQEMSLTAMAAQLGMSRAYFATQFKQAMGVSPHQYVSQQRIEKAKRCLQTRALSLAEIALTCGFSSQSHLTKTFKKYTGTTPKAYRENC